jgi:hypothetical protein
MTGPISPSLKNPSALKTVAFLRQFYNIASERAINITYKLAEFQTILGLKAAKYFQPDMFNAMTNLSNNHTRYIINTCILVKFLKLQRVPPLKKREKYHIIFPKSNKQQATSNKQQATSNKQQTTSNKQQATNIKSNFLKGCIRILILTHALCNIFYSTYTV